MRPVSMVIFQHKCRKAEDAIALLETGDGGADFMDKAREGHWKLQRDRLSTWGKQKDFKAGVGTKQKNEKKQSDFQV